MDNEILGTPQVNTSDNININEAARHFKEVLAKCFCVFPAEDCHTRKNRHLQRSGGNLTELDGHDESRMTNHGSSCLCPEPGGSRPSFSSAPIPGGGPACHLRGPSSERDTLGRAVPSTTSGGESIISEWLVDTP